MISEVPARYFVETRAKWTFRQSRRSGLLQAPREAGLGVQRPESRSAYAACSRWVTSMTPGNASTWATEIRDPATHSTRFEVAYTSSTSISKARTTS